MASWPRSTASTSRSTSTATGPPAPTTAEREAAWAEYYSEGGEGTPPEGEPPAGLEQRAAAAAAADETPETELVAEVEAEAVPEA